MIIKTEKIGKLSVWTEKDPKGQLTKIVYFDYRPVVSLMPDNINERRIAVVQLVELKYCNQNNAGKICGFHRNTVFSLLRTKRLLGIEALFEDDRGPKSNILTGATSRLPMRQLNISRHLFLVALLPA